MLDKFSYSQIEHAAVFEKARKMLYKIEQDILDTYEGIQLSLTPFLFWPEVVSTTS